MWRLVFGVFLVLLAACGDVPAGGAGGKGLIVVGEPTVTSNSGLVLVAGRVKNEAARPYTGIVVVTLFDAAGKIVGTCNGAANDVPPGEEVTYQAASAGLITGEWAKVEAKISTQMAR